MEFFINVNFIKCHQHLVHQKKCRTVVKFTLKGNSGNHWIQFPPEGGSNCKIRSGCSGYFPAEFCKSPGVEIPGLLGNHFQCLPFTLRFLFIFSLYSWKIAFCYKSQRVIQEWNLKPNISGPTFWSIVLALKFLLLIPILISNI